MSVAIAVVLWLIVVNIDNPTGTNYYTLNDVELINKEYVESSDTIGKMCMPEQNQDSVKVAITATKKIRDKIKVTDISAVADLQQAVSLDTNPVMVPITVTCSVPGVSPSDIKVTPQNLSVNLDQKETQEFDAFIQDKGAFGHTDNQKLEAINTQAWILHFTNPAECWANVRRSGYPKLKSPAEYGFGQYLTGGTEIPVRLCYPVLESSYNKKSYNEAIERMGGTDNWHSLLWWDTEN